jgi:hypothetical protein
MLVSEKHSSLYSFVSWEEENEICE